jgi:hypothetical protein
MTAQANSRFMLVGLVLTVIGGVGAVTAFVRSQDFGSIEYLMPRGLIGIGMMLAAKLTPVQG